MENTVQYGLCSRRSCDVCPKSNVFPHSHGAGVVGYFTTPLVSSSSKSHLIKSHSDLVDVDISGTSRDIPPIIILSTGGSVLKSKL